MRYPYLEDPLGHKIMTSFLNAGFTTSEPAEREPKTWMLPETDDDLHEFCMQLSAETRRRLYKHLHALGERI